MRGVAHDVAAEEREHLWRAGRRRRRDSGEGEGVGGWREKAEVAASHFSLSAIRWREGDKVDLGSTILFYFV